MGTLLGKIIVGFAGFVLLVSGAVAVFAIDVVTIDPVHLPVGNCNNQRMHFKGTMTYDAPERTLTVRINNDVTIYGPDEGPQSVGVTSEWVSGLIVLSPGIHTIRAVITNNETGETVASAELDFAIPFCDGFPPDPLPDDEPSSSPEVPAAVSGNITVTNVNYAIVRNQMVGNASTGGNTSSGGRGGIGGSGSVGVGGKGGEGGTGGLIVTGVASVRMSIGNILNSSRTIVRYSR